MLRSAVCRIAVRQSFLATLRVPTVYGTSIFSRSLSSTQRRLEAVSPTANVNKTDSSILNTEATEALDLSALAENLVTDLITADGRTPSLGDYGLGGWTPWGLIQTALNELHSLGVPWWLSITLGTVTLRLTLLPLIIKSQQYNVTLNNNTPKILELKLRLIETRQMGNELEFERAQNDFMKFCEEKKVNPLYGFAPMIIQIPIFVSCFLAIRGMTNLPLESMKTGGFYWVSDLTTTDPYCILPLFTSSALFCSTYLASKTQVQTQDIGIFRYGMYALPFIIFPISMQFASGVVWYWTTTNTFTFCQLVFLNISTVRKWFGIPKIIHHKLPKPGIPLEKMTAMRPSQRTRLREAVTSALKSDMPVNQPGRFDRPKMIVDDSPKRPSIFVVFEFFKKSAFFEVNLLDSQPTKMLLNVYRLTTQRSILPLLKTSNLYLKETLPLRSFSATPKKFEAELFKDISFSSTTKLKNELTSADIPNIKSFCPDASNDEARCGFEELDANQFVNGVRPGNNLLAAVPITATTAQSLADAGLGGWTPPGLVQVTLDNLHSIGLPWWVAIVVSTFTIKLLLIPLVVKSRISSVRLQNNMPEMMKLQLKMSEARTNRDHVAAKKAAEELVAFYREKNCSPISPILPIVAQAPFFISFFLGIRQMASLPLESMKNGGVLWFTDLTIADPFYILPFLTSLSMLATLEVGAETGTKPEQMQQMKYFLRAIPVLIFPATMWFPSAVLCYWLTSNVFTLGQVAILNVPAVRQWFNIPERIPHVHVMPPIMTMNQRKPAEMMREFLRNSQISKELEERGLGDRIRQKQAAIKACASASNNKIEQTSKPCFNHLPKLGAIERKEADKRKNS
ncbi:uncharacterized protein LOC111260232 [Varroa jacobsoni]|uniref:uncharacterized protein LOC111260232 n=1 Tax=Varroa jacobsoni TaxID=62625 RepID=UPI000BF2ED81|nr:uncharacterized protein LOC111260232 [Varroa jacobsoni]